MIPLKFLFVYGAGAGWAATGCGERRPFESKTSVLASASAPCAGISFPFHKNVTPAAFPTFTLISRFARKEAWAGAISVSSLTVCPSALTEIQEFSEARITRTKDGALAGCALAGGAGGSAGCCAGVPPDAGLDAGFSGVVEVGLGDAVADAGCELGGMAPGIVAVLTGVEAAGCVSGAGDAWTWSPG